MPSLQVALPIAVIAAIARNRVIGAGNRLPWHAPGDLRRFRTLTWNCPVIVGRKTFESMPHPLPGRELVVVTRDERWSHPDPTIHSARSLEDAIDQARLIGDIRQSHAIWIAGGGVIYQQAIPHADHLHLTIVDCAPEGDVYFPDIEMDVWAEVGLVSHDTTEDGISMRRMTFERVAPAPAVVCVEGEIANDALPAAARSDMVVA